MNDENQITTTFAKNDTPKLIKLSVLGIAAVVFIIALTMKLVPWVPDGGRNPSGLVRAVHGGDAGPLGAGRSRSVIRLWASPARMSGCARPASGLSRWWGRLPL